MDTILVIVAHADDETLGCGASIARWSQEHDVIVGVLASDRIGRTAEGPEMQFRRAATLLGFEPVMASFPDQKLDVTPLLDITQQVETWLRHYRPAHIITHHVSDLNLDHRVVAQAVHTATRPPWQGSLEAMEIASSTEWSYGLREPRFTPNIYRAITREELDLKIQALKCYTTEIREPPHPRSPMMLEARAMYWGGHCGTLYAEPFQLIKRIEP